MNQPEEISLAGRGDGDLLAGFVEHRQEAVFAEIMRRHGGMVMAVCRSVLGNTADAEDAMQAVFLTLAQKASSIRSGTLLIGWLHRVAWYIASRAAVAKAIRRRHEQEAARMRQDAIPPNDAQISLEILHAGLAGLPKKYRVPLLLHYLEGKTQEELAAFMECGVNAAAVRLTRGRQMLRERLVKRGAAISASSLAIVLAGQVSAAISTSLVAATANAATSVLTGQAVSSTVISGKIMALSKGALNMLFIAKIKIAAMVTAAVAVFGGAVAGTYMTAAAGPKSDASGGVQQKKNAVVAGNPQAGLPVSHSAGEEAPAKYSWQKPHAKVLATGDLEWAPQPFVFEKGNSTRYIDFEAGDDAHDGTTKDQAWKHHPWDANASGKAKVCRGVHTYVFKRGVAYRGSLVASESGAAGNPIHLTSDPAWGSGEASIVGCERLDKGWQKCNAGEAPANMPQPEMVWHRELPAGVPARALWEVGQEGLVRIPVARSPNWTLTNPNDPMAGFWSYTEVAKAPDKWHCDPQHLKGLPDIAGSRIWTEWNGNMGTLYLNRVAAFDANQGRLKIDPAQVPSPTAAGNRYYLENMPAFLDSPGEYWVDEKARRIYLRLPGDRDPNGARMEASARVWLLTIVDQSNIRISGLRFACDDSHKDKESWPVHCEAPTCIRVVGTCGGIKVDHCRFEHVTGAFLAFTRMNKAYTATYMKEFAQSWKEDLLDDIEVSDNDISWSDRGDTISFFDGKTLTRIVQPPYGLLGHISILRNRMRWIGHRPGGNSYSSIPAIHVLNAHLLEVAGNDLQHCWGIGIFTRGGKTTGCVSDSPLMRILVHHNRVVDTVLATNDYGGLAAWQGGPNYLYDNVVGNAVGHKSAIPTENDWKTTAYNIYLDGAFKSYVFNNISGGRSNDMKDPYRNRAGYLTVLGFTNHLFNNTIYRFVHGIAGSSGNRSCYLGNVIADVKGSFIQQNKPGDTSLAGGGDTGAMGNRGVPTLAYSHNIFAGKSSTMGNVGPVRGDTLAALRAELEKVPVLLGDLGAAAPDNPLMDPAKGDFRPKSGAPTKGQGVRFFVPWGLYATVAEWNFYPHPKNPDTVMGEHFYMTPEYLDRLMYDLIPRNDLKVSGAAVSDYVPGALEDWINGALHFDGKGRFGVLADAELKRDYEIPFEIATDGKVTKGKSVIRGADRRTPDIGTANLLIEAWFRTEKGHAGSTLVSKTAAAGYLLGFDANGHACLTLRLDGKNAVSLAGKTAVNDGAWHHVIAEVDRAAKRAMIYVDGKIDGEAKGIALDPAASLGNDADLLVGKGPDGGFFAGDLDFLRICRGTLADAKTTIEELYTWETDGPFLRDFTGAKPTDGRRDAGAIQGR